MQKNIWWLLIIAVVGDFLVPYLLAPFYKGYSHKKQVMSVLGNPESPVKTLYNIWLIMLGILLAISTLNIAKLYYTVSRCLTIALVISVLIFSIGAGILAGVFSVNKTKEIQTLASKIHGIGSALGFMALMFDPLFISILSFKQSYYIMWAVSGFSFILASLFFILFIASDKKKFESTIINNEGLWQRLSLLFMYIPFLFMALSDI